MLTIPSPVLRKRLYIVESKGDSKTRVTVKLLSRRSYCHAQKRPFLPLIQESGSYPTYAHKSDCGATSSECGRHWHKEKTIADGAVRATEV